MRRMLCSKNFSAASKSLRKEIASRTRNLLTNPSLLEPYLAARLTNPDICPIGIAESSAALHNNCKIRQKSISKNCQTVYSWWNDDSI